MNRCNVSETEGRKKVEQLHIKQRRDFSLEMEGVICVVEDFDLIGTWIIG